MSNMTQNLYNEVSEHMLKQFERSLNEEGNPAYRGLNGMTGPVGSLISNEDYHVGLEGYTVADDIILEAVGKSYGPIQKETRKMLLGCQLIHDEHFVCDWRSKLRLLGKICGLSPIEVK